MIITSSLREILMLILTSIVALFHLTEESLVLGISFKSTLMSLLGVLYILPHSIMLFWPGIYSYTKRMSKLSIRGGLLWLRCIYISRFRVAMGWEFQFSIDLRIALIWKELLTVNWIMLHISSFDSNVAKKYTSYH